MAGIRDFIVFEDDFIGEGVLPTSATAGQPWLIDDTSSAGTPTYTYDASSNGGAVTLAFDNTSEIQNVCLHFGDNLCFDIDKLQRFECYLKMGQATADTATSFAFGLASARNDAIDSIAEAALFRVIGATSTTLVVVESDDGTNNNDDKATGKTLINAYKRFEINFEAGTSDVRFYIDGDRVAASTTFDMSNYTGSLQPIFQLQKTADTNVDSFTLDYCRVECRR